MQALAVTTSKQLINYPATDANKGVFTIQNFGPNAVRIDKTNTGAGLELLPGDLWENPRGITVGASRYVWCPTGTATVNHGME